MQLCDLSLNGVCMESLEMRNSETSETAAKD